MKRLALCALLLCAVAMPARALAQRAPVDAASATRHYRTGWDMMRIEAFADAAKQFQAAIDIDERFALAYYALGRANMALKNFPAATAAYLKCKDIYLARATDRFTNQMEASKYLDDQLIEHREVLRLMTAPGTSPQGQTTSQSLNRLRDSIRRLEESKARNSSVTFDMHVPFFVSLALGAAYFRTERFVDAEREYRAALDDNPHSGETHNNLAVLYLVQNRLVDAEREIALAEKTGFKVNEGLKDDLKKKAGR